MDRKVARLHLLPGGGVFAGFRAETFEFCMINRIIGVGWYAGAPKQETFTWGDYLAQQERRDLASVQGLHDLSKGDLVWVRDPSGSYYIAEVRGPWAYKSSPLHVAMDIVNVRPVEFFAVNEGDVTQGVRNAFTPVTFRYIQNKEVIQHTINVWKGAF